MSIQSEIDRIKAAKADAKAALIERGVDPGDATIDEYGNQIRAIQTGVTSFNGRTGAVKPQAGDYTAEQVGALPISGGTMTGQLNMGGKLLRGVANPAQGQDAVNKQYANDNYAAKSHNHNASAINDGTLPIARGGTGVSAMAGTDYTTNRPRGIILKASEPSTVANGCLVGVYE